MWTLSQAALDVLAERRGQVEREGWTPEHDDQHSVEELQKAGVAYASVGACVLPEIFWPWGREWWKPKWRGAMRSARGKTGPNGPAQGRAGGESLGAGG